MPSSTDVIDREQPLFLRDTGRVRCYISKYDPGMSAVTDFPAAPPANPRRTSRRPMFFLRPIGLPFMALCLLILPQCSASTSSDLIEQGVRFTEEENYSRAIEAFDKAIEKNPNNPKAYFGLGGIYNIQKNHNKAIDLFRKAVQIDPTYVDAYYGLAFTYETLGKTAEAEENYQKYRELKKKLDGYLEKGKSAG
jgi:tetratricopeptide (TPR) repeat protein